MPNVFDQIPTELTEELTETLLNPAAFRLERIISRGHQSPEGFWYQQEQNEWVLLLQGEAQLTFADGREPQQLRAGDYLLIPANLRHRVTHTSSTPEAIWLCLFF